MPIDLTAYQLTRLGAALHGTVNELKQFGMADRRSAVPGFAEAFGQLFPDAAEGLDALDLVPEAVGLRRRFADAVRDAEAEVEAAREAAEAEAERQRRGRWGRLRERLGGLFGARSG